MADNSKVNKSESALHRTAPCGMWAFFNSTLKQALGNYVHEKRLTPCVFSQNTHIVLKSSLADYEKSLSK